MRRLVLCCLTFSLFAFAAPKEQDWKVGKLVDSKPSGQKYVLNVPLDVYNYVIQGSDYIYTAQLVIKLNNGCRFIVGDQIKYAQDGGSLYLIDSLGKKCTLDIVRQERREATAAPPTVTGDEKPKGDEQKIAGTYDELMGLLSQAYQCGIADGAIYLATYDVPGQSQKEKTQMHTIADGMRHKREENHCADVVDKLGLSGQK